MLAFINQHGGLAIGGSRFVIPQKPGKPISKDGQSIREGEWFVDQNGNKVKMTKNAKGEEEYEMQEGRIKFNYFFLFLKIKNIRMNMEINKRE